MSEVSNQLEWIRTNMWKKDTASTPTKSQALPNRIVANAQQSGSNTRTAQRSSASPRTSRDFQPLMATMDQSNAANAQPATMTPQSNTYQAARTLHSSSTAQPTMATNSSWHSLQQGNRGLSFANPSRITTERTERTQVALPGSPMAGFPKHQLSENLFASLPSIQPLDSAQPLDSTMPLDSAMPLDILSMQEQITVLLSRVSALEALLNGQATVAVLQAELDRMTLSELEESHDPVIDAPLASDPETAATIQEADSMEIQEITLEMGETTTETPGSAAETLGVATEKTDEELDIFSYTASSCDDADDVNEQETKEETKVYDDRSPDWLQ